MTIRTITFAAAAAIAAAGFTAPATAASLGAAGQSFAQTMTQDGDSQIIQVGNKKHGKHGKWHGKHGKHSKHGKWHGGHGNWNGHGYGFGIYPSYGYAPYGGCFQQVQVNIGGHYIWQTVQVC